jgi:hypothetical protein
MSQIFETALGDRWSLDGRIATSLTSGKAYRSSEQMSEYLNISFTSEKAAQALRELDQANLDVGLTGQYLLVPDAENPGWLRMVDPKNPAFDFSESDYFHGEFLLSDKDPSIAVSCLVSDPGSTCDGWHVMRFNHADKAYTPIHYAETLDDCQKFIDAGVFPEPLPAVNWHDSKIIDLHDGYKAELITANYINVGNSDSVLVTIFDSSGSNDFKIRCSASTLIEMRDDVDFFDKIKAQHKGEHSKEITVFNNAKEFVPTDEKHLTEKIRSMKANTPMKLLTADKLYEIVISWMPVQTIRGQNRELLAHGKELPSSYDLDNCEDEKLVVGKEKGFHIMTKKVGGAIIEDAKRLTINIPCFYQILSSEPQLAKLKDLAGEFQSNGGENPPLTAHEEVIYAMAREDEEVTYIHKQEVPIEQVRESVRKMSLNRESFGFDDDIPW